MKPLYALLGAFIISIIVIKLGTKQADYMLAGRIAMAAVLVFTAIGHFAFTKGMSAMIPDFLPFKVQLVIVTGVLEIALAVGLLFPNTKEITAWATIIFFILIIPANIKAAMENLNFQTGKFDGPGINYLWFRIPLQLLFIVWVYFSSIWK